jgi:hypothetical protein
MIDPESQRLKDDDARKANWKRWGTYLPERQWGTVREDYSASGNAWADFSHDMARSRAYRWGEDGLLGLTDRECRLCFAPALWNGNDPILKERLFGLSNPEGNHGEDVKELYYYLDATPTHSYCAGLYKYPHRAFPYGQLIEQNARRSKDEPEFELLDTGVFDHGWFDLLVEYAKGSPDDLGIRLTVTNRGPRAPVHLLPTLWFRNTWAWGRSGEGYWPRPRIALDGNALAAEHASLGRFRFECDGDREWLFTENETNFARLFPRGKNATPFVKDAFHRYVCEGRRDAVNPAGEGTKAAAYFQRTLDEGESFTARLRLTAEGERKRDPFAELDAVFSARREEADRFYAVRLPGGTEDERRVSRQASAGLLWSKQFYGYAVGDWLEGDPASPPPPAARREVRNGEWENFYSRDVLSMPDKWEYPWFAAWDLAFHTLPLARLDTGFAKDQILLLLREWYMHPSGQLPAYEYNFSDVNPPVHAWAAWRVYKRSGPKGKRDTLFLRRAFHKLLLNFTWWVNRKDVSGKNLFAGGFLGLDNIGVFDRSKPLPYGGSLEQADGTAWMAFFCTTLLAISLELAREDPAYEDIASKFFEHFVAIADAMNAIGGVGLWDEEDGFYYDQLRTGGRSLPLKVRSMVGLIPLFACEVLEDAQIEALPGFQKRMRWFLENRKDLAKHVSYLSTAGAHEGHRLLAIPSRERLTRVLRYALDEREFLSDHGLRSLSKFHEESPYQLEAGDERYEVRYCPAESDSGLFGGNSNWRGPVWMPLNYLFIEALERYHHFYGDSLKVECPTGSGQMMNLQEVASELARRLGRLFLADGKGQRPVHAGESRYAREWKDLVLFYEYFHGDTGRGLGANHQTGWSALAIEVLADAQRARAHDDE